MNINDSTFLWKVAYKKLETKPTTIIPAHVQTIYIACVNLSDLQNIFDSYLPDNFDLNKPANSDFNGEYIYMIQSVELLTNNDEPIIFGEP